MPCLVDHVGFASACWLWQLPQPTTAVLLHCTDWYTLLPLKGAALLWHQMLLHVPWVYLMFALFVSAAFAAAPLVLYIGLTAALLYGFVVRPSPALYAVAEPL